MCRLLGTQLALFFIRNQGVARRQGDQRQGLFTPDGFDGQSPAMLTVRRSSRNPLNAKTSSTRRSFFSGFQTNGVLPIGLPANCTVAPAGTDFSSILTVEGFGLGTTLGRGGSGLTTFGLRDSRVGGFGGTFPGDSTLFGCFGALTTLFVVFAVPPVTFAGLRCTGFFADD